MIRRPPPMLVGLGLFNLVLLGALVNRVIDGSQLESIQSAAMNQPSRAFLRIDMPPPPPNLESVQSQAVFYKSRTFYVAPAVAAIEQPPPNYRLTGAMAMPNRPLTAMLVHNDTGARVKVAVGDQLEEWSVAEVTTRRIVIQQGARSAEIGSTSGRPGVTAISSAPVDSASPINGSPSGGIVRMPAGAVQPSSVAHQLPPATANESPRLYRRPRQ